MSRFRQQATITSRRNPSFSYWLKKYQRLRLRRERRSSPGFFLRLLAPGEEQRVF
jgi:hypothetical protein